MKELKDWTTSITGLDEMGPDDVVSLYSEMLASAHDTGYKVPDAQLIESEDAAAIAKVIPPLHEGLVKFHASAKAAADAKAAKEAKAPKAVKAKKTDEAAPKNPVKKTAKKAAAPQKEEKTMAKVAKKAAKAPAAKKAAKAPAKKAAKKAAAANARTGVGRNPFGEKAVIKVLPAGKEKDIAKAGSERLKRIEIVKKYSGKKVADFYANEKPPYNRTDTLRMMIDRGFIEVK